MGVNFESQPLVLRQGPVWQAEKFRLDTFVLLVVIFPPTSDPHPNPEWVIAYCIQYFDKGVTGWYCFNVARGALVLLFLFHLVFFLVVLSKDFCVSFYVHCFFHVRDSVAFDLLFTCSLNYYAFFSDSSLDLLICILVINVTIIVSLVLSNDILSLSSLFLRLCFWLFQIASRCKFFEILTVYRLQVFQSRKFLRILKFISNESEKTPNSSLL